MIVALGDILTLCWEISDDRKDCSGHALCSSCNTLVCCAFLSVFILIQPRGPLKSFTKETCVECFCIKLREQRFGIALLSAKRMVLHLIMWWFLVHFSSCVDEKIFFNESNFLPASNNDLMQILLKICFKKIQKMLFGIVKESWIYLFVLLVSNRTNWSLPLQNQFLCMQPNQKIKNCSGWIVGNLEAVVSVMR